MDLIVILCLLAVAVEMGVVAMDAGAAAAADMDLTEVLEEMELTHLVRDVPQAAVVAGQ
jgi:hypothetical protein